MPRWPLMFLFVANALAAQQPPAARPDSARVARVLALLETSDSTVCELAAQAISNAWGWSWEPQLLPTPMPMPMPAPMPMPMMRQGHGPRARVHLNHRAGWRGADSAAFGAFRVVLRFVNWAVHFEDERGFMAVEIGDEPRDNLLAAKLRRSNIDASAGAVEEIRRVVAPIRRRWALLTSR